MGITREALSFLYACLLGAGLGILYDVFRLLRLLLFKNRVVVFLEDLLFSAMCTLATLAFLVEFCSGRVRVYALLGELLGFILYHFTVGELVIRVLKGLIALFKAVLHGIYRVFVFPIWKIIRWIARKTASVFGSLLQCFKRLTFLKNFHLQERAGMLYNKHNKHVRQNKGGVELDES